MKNQYEHDQHIPVVWSGSGGKLVWRECLIPPHVYTLFVFLTLNTLCWILPKPRHRKSASCSQQERFKGCAWDVCLLSFHHSAPLSGSVTKLCVFKGHWKAAHLCFLSAGDSLLIGRLIVLLHCLQTGRTPPEWALPFLTTGSHCFKM